MTLGIPSTPGVPAGRRRPTRSSAASTTSTASPPPCAQYGEGLAAILVEPVAGNMGCVPPAPGFLEALRTLVRRHRRAARLRRGDHRLPRRARRRPGALRRHARPDDARQDRRRRPAARGVRRPGRADGAARAGRRRLPGGHALGQPARDRRGHLGAAPAARPAASTTSSSGSARALEAGLAPLRARCSASARC